MFFLAALPAEPDPPFVAEGKDVKMIAYRKDGEWVEQLFAKDAKGAFRMVLASPNFAAKGVKQSSGAIQGFSRGLYNGVPDFHFTDVKGSKQAGYQVVTFTVKDGPATITKRVFIPATGNHVKLELNADLGVKRTQLHALLMSYVFVPDGKGDAPDSTFLPGFRPGDNNVVGDHFFRAPAAVAQKGSLAALLMPDLDVLADNRPMETIIDLDNKNGVTNGALLTYGFCAHRLSGHVYFTTDSSMVRSVPGELKLAADLIVDAKAEPKGAYGQAVQFTWAKYGHKTFDTIKPQMMPFEGYANVCYPAVFAEQYGANKLGWFEVTIDGKVCGGVPSGWGFTEGWVSWQCWFNQLRSAWGLRWWGKKLGNQDWVDKADKMLNLALAAPMKEGAVPTTYLSREKQWKGSLIAPDARCYYDLTNMAWKGIWMLRWLEFADCPRRQEIVDQVIAMADLMVKKQNADGSIPTWLDQNLNVVPVLDHSAQTALPAWFLAELGKAQLPPELIAEVDGGFADKEYREAAIKAADFLVKDVVDQQRWYDFETFFSCSPKTCLQRDGKVDDLQMHDSHSMSPPQNTLCMQWAAEALNTVANFRDMGNVSRYQSSAMKALNIMALYQNAWDISYRKVAFDFGGFGVQNSDGEYNDARQAQFGCTMADFGVQLGRQDLFERGVAATRASLTLINHPLHVQYDIYPNPNYPLGLQPENNGHGGTDQQNGRTGFDWGEGSGLASMAWLLDKYGPTYKHGKGWSVIVDGGSKAIAMIKPAKPIENPTWNFDDWRMNGWTVIGDFAEVPTWSTRMSFGVGRDEGFIGTCEDGQGGFNDQYTGTLTSPKFTVTKGKIKLLVGGGSGKGVYVELLGPDGSQIYVERGRDRERMDERSWDVGAYRGKELQIRIVDRETGGWGHINVARILCTD